MSSCGRTGVAQTLQLFHGSTRTKKQHKDGSSLIAHAISLVSFWQRSRSFVPLAARRRRSESAGGTCSFVPRVLSVIVVSGFRMGVVSTLACVSCARCLLSLWLQASARSRSVVGCPLKSSSTTALRVFNFCAGFLNFQKFESAQHDLWWRPACRVVRATQWRTLPSSQMRTTSKATLSRRTCRMTPKIPTTTTSNRATLMTTTSSLVRRELARMPLNSACCDVSCR